MLSFRFRVVSSAVTKRVDYLVERGKDDYKNRRRRDYISLTSTTWTLTFEHLRHSYIDLNFSIFHQRQNCATVVITIKIVTDNDSTSSSSSHNIIQRFHKPPSASLSDITVGDFRFRGVWKWTCPSCNANVLWMGHVEWKEIATWHGTFQDYLPYRWVMSKYGVGSSPAWFVIDYRVCIR